MDTKVIHILAVFIAFIIVLLFFVPTSSAENVVGIIINKINEILFETPMASSSLSIDPVDTSGFVKGEYDRMMFGGESFASTCTVRTNLYCFIGDGGSVRKYNFAGINDLASVDWGTTALNQEYSIIPTGSLIKKLMIQGNVLYVLGVQGFSAIDITNINYPKVLGTYGGIDDRFEYTGMDISGNTAYLTSPWNGISKIDISIPSNLRLIGNIPVDRASNCITVSGNYAYVCLQGDTYYEPDSVAIYDIQTNALVSKWTPGIYENTPMDVVINNNNNIMYASWWRTGLYVVDVTFKSSPKTVTSIKRDAAKLFFDTNNKILYLSERYSTVSIWNTANPVPVLMGENTKNSGYTNSITVFDYNGKRYTVINSESIGANIYDITNPNNIIKYLPSFANPSSPMTPTIPTLGGVYVMLAKGDRIWALGRNEYIWQINIANNKFVIEDLLDYSSRVEAAVLSKDGCHIYFTRGSGLGSIGICSDKMILEGINNDVDAQMVIETDGRYVFTQDTYKAQQGLSTLTNTWFYTVDMAVPKFTTTDITGSWNSPVVSYGVLSPSEMHWYNAKTLAISSGYNNGGVRFFDTTNPASPSQIAATNGNVRSFTFSGNFMYTADDNYIVTVYDVSNLNSIKYLKTITIDSMLATTMRVHGNTMYVQWQNKGKISKIDISNPSNIFLIKTLDMKNGEQFDYTTPATKNNNYMIFGGGKNGIYLLNTGTLPVPTQTIPSTPQPTGTISPSPAPTGTVTPYPIITATPRPTFTPIITVKPILIFSLLDYITHNIVWDFLFG